MMFSDMKWHGPDDNLEDDKSGIVEIEVTVSYDDDGTVKTADAKIVESESAD